MQDLPVSLQPLARWRQFITYRLVPDPEKPGKMIKKPCRWDTGKTADPMDPANWTDFATAARYAPLTGCHGVGFVFTEHDPFWFHDIDNALQPDGQWSPLAQSICARLAGAAVEVSQSGSGLHIIGSGVVPPHGCRNIPLGLELYHANRFVALTGTGAVGDAGADLTAQIWTFATEYFPPNASNGFDGWTTEPVADWSGPADDDELIRIALASGQRNAAAAFGAAGVVTFRDLWEANADALGAKWPGNGLKPFDGSSADAALASHLAYWTGKDCERIRRLMDRSALKRDKWERDNYIEPTIINACGVVSKVAQAKPAAPPPPPPTSEQVTAAADAGISLRDPNGEYLQAGDQMQFFAGCVYIVDEDRILTPDGERLNRSRFDSVYGGHVFVMDPVGKDTSKSAWEAFTENRIFTTPRAWSTCFRPELPGGAMVYEENRALVNTWVPISTYRVAGDPTPFLTFLEKLLPNERDRRITLSYMAACLQNPGRKFQWWPVYQGVEGNGKTLLLRIMAHAIGARYTHLPNADDMARNGNKFNKWIEGNLFIGIEEICVGHKRDFLESFKATVTNDRIGVEGKGADQRMGDNRANGALYTNHRDGIPVNADMRRYAIFYTAQQRAEDLERDGMSGSYFPDLYDWLYGRGAYAAFGTNYGLAVVNNYLAAYAVEAEFNPAGLCVRAPATSSTQEAIAASLGRAEQEIAEAISEGRPGFCGGWVSSIMVDHLLERIRANVPRNKRRELIQRLGYDWHPMLDEGRVNNRIDSPDAGKPRLFVRAGHPALALERVADIEKAYSAAQQPGAGVSAAIVAFTR